MHTSAGSYRVVAHCKEWTCNGVSELYPCENFEKTYRIAAHPARGDLENEEPWYTTSPALYAH